jgi:hypothetical protein
MSTQNLRWEIPLQNSGGPNLLLAGDAPSILSPLLLVFSACKVSKKSPRNDNMQTGERFFLNQRKDNGKKKSGQPGEDRLLSALLIIGSPAFIARLRFKESLTSACRSRRIPTAYLNSRIVLG